MPSDIVSGIQKPVFSIEQLLDGFLLDSEFHLTGLLKDS
jgi:hypothetical protein